jgi:circadian clock protein KaiC
MLPGDVDPRTEPLPPVLKVAASAQKGLVPLWATGPRLTLQTLPKVPSGVHGLDEITGGGLPRGRPTLICGGAGCGKTLFAMEFLVRGAVEHGEPGVFMAFEETSEELAANVASLGFDLQRLIAQRKLAIDYVRVERSEIEETGEYDLEGLFVRLQYAIDSVGAKRVVLDTVESLFSGLPNPAVLRAELRRLFRWLKDREMTVVITGEKGDGTLTRHGLEEYVSDCVIFLDHRVTDQTSTRRLRVVKYRGTAHGTNEYPFLIDEGGISILPVTSLGLTHRVTTERLSTGIPRLDEMLGGKGYFKGSTILVSGTAGTGKTTFAATLARAACERGDRVLYFSFEESPDQLMRNMRSVGIDLQPYLKSGAFEIHASRPTAYGLERHLVTMHKVINQRRPDLVIVDPITNLIRVGTLLETQAMIIRLTDFLKMRGTTAFFTSLSGGGEDLEESEVGISSLIDTWLTLAAVRSGGERNRTVAIVKSRGMAHSNQTREFALGRHGVSIADTYLGASGVLTGSARLAREAEDEASARALDGEIARKQEERERRRRQVEAQILLLREGLEADDAELDRVIEAEARRRDRLATEKVRMAKSRHAFAGKDGRSRPAAPRARKGR